MVETSDAGRKRKLGDQTAEVEAGDTITWCSVEAGTAAELGDEIDQGGTQFQLEYYHQTFGEEEKIQGYEGLSINIWMSTRTYHAWVDVSYDKKLPKADDLHRLLGDSFPAGYLKDRRAFEAAVTAGADTDWGSFGRNVLSRTVDLEGEPYELKIQHFKLVDAPAEVKALHQRMEPLLLFTIDGANFIEEGDDKWELLLAVLRAEDGSSLVAGFATVYNFYAWPMSQRPRLAQVLVVPPYQGAGIGKALLLAAYQLAKERDAVDLTFEDPSDNLQRVREKIDVEAMRGCKWLTDMAAAAVGAAGAAAEAAAAAAAAAQPRRSAGAASSSEAGAAEAAAAASKQLQLSDEAAAQLAKELKIHPREARTAWEAVLYLTPQLASTPAAQAGFQAMVADRLVAQHLGGRDRSSDDKRIVEVEAKDECWFMWKARQRRPGGEGECDAVSMAGRHTVAELTDEERTEREERLADMMSERLEQLAELRTKLLAL